jgi:hypothetical protein
MDYITKSNYSKIFAKIDNKKLSTIGGEVYHKKLNFLNSYEEKLLLAKRLLMQEPELFINTYYVPIHVNDTYTFVYEGGKPAYHYISDCERLNSNYVNFKIPQEIFDMGHVKISEFRQWFKDNRHLLENSEVFVAKLELAFGIKMNPKGIVFNNSGVESIKNLYLFQLEQRIESYLDKARSYFEEADNRKREVIKKFSKLTFLAYKEDKIYNNYTGFTDQAVKKLSKTI